MITAALARTRSPHETHFRVEVKTISRSAGRSAVFASAYRSGERLHDRRQGLTADYTRKQGIVSAFILAPPQAGAWAFDRSALWTAAEMAEKHPRATTAREVLVSIPREIAPEDHEAWMRQMCAPYVAAGAVVDVAIHAPSAADGQPNYHAHIMLTERALSQDGQGFAPTKNAALLGMFQSGGRMGGSPGDAIKAERQRWASGINSYMRARDLTVRADHRSRWDRGARDLEVEPNYGEVAAARYKRTKQPSRNQQIVGVMRHRRRAEQVAIAMEVAMEHTVQRSSKVPYRQSKQDVKASLLRERIPDLDTSGIDKDAIYRVDVSNKAKTVVQMRDDSMCELRGGRLYVYGSTDGGTAQRLAEAIAEANGWEADTITRLPPSVRMRAPEGRYKRRVKSEEEIDRIVDYWREAGYTDVSTCKQGVWVTLGSSRLLDSGDRVTLHGPISDDAIAAMVGKARDQWAGRCEIWGSDEFRERYWLEAQRQGVEVTNYDPPPHIKAQADAERKERGKEVAAVTAVADAATTAREALRYVREETNDLHVSAELRAYLDSLRDPKSGKFDTRAARTIANMETAQVAPLVIEMERKGATIIEEQAAAEAAQAPKPRPQRRKDDEPEADAPETPAPGRRR